MTATAALAELAELDALDQGRHHLWCARCHPEWATRPQGADLGVPFTAWCGIRAVILVPTDQDLPPGYCRVCADPGRSCAVCGWTGT